MFTKCFLAAILVVYCFGRRIDEKAKEAYNSENDDHYGVLDFVQVQGRTYWVGKYEKASFFNASVSCQRYGMELVSIFDEEKHRIVHDLIRTENYEIGLPYDDGEHHYWTSGNKQNDKAHWVWLKGVPITYFDWAIEEPNNYMKDEDCIMVYGTNGKFNDDPCEDKKYFVCEKIDDSIYY